MTTPLAWAQYEPGSDVDKTQTSGTFGDADATNLVVSFTGPASGLVVPVFNGLWIGSSANTYGAVNIRDSGGDLAMTHCQMVSGNNRHRSDYRHVQTVTPGNSYTWKLGIAGDGTHVAGVRVGPEKPCLLAIYDGGASMAGDRLAYLLTPTLDGVDGHGGSIATAATTSWQRAQRETPSLEYYDWSDFVVPASGKVMWGFQHPSMVTASLTTADTFFGLWDRDAGAFLAGSGMSAGGGAATARWSGSLRRVVTGLTPGATARYGLAYRIDAGTNAQVLKVDQDSKESPFIGWIYGVA